MLEYPAQTTNSSYLAPSIIELTDESKIINDIEYPSLKDIAMKDSILPSADGREQQINRPAIDRSSKESALKALQQKESLTNKKVENTKSMLTTVSQLTEVRPHLNFWHSDKLCFLIYFYSFKKTNKAWMSIRKNKVKSKSYPINFWKLQIKEKTM